MSKPAPIIEKTHSHKIHNPAPQITQYNKMKNIQKLKSLVEFNGNLLIKFSKNLKNLNSQEIIYYNKIAHENLKKLEEIVREAYFLNLIFLGRLCRNQKFISKKLA